MRLSLPSVSTEGVVFGLCTFVAASALVIGGGARVGYLTDAVLQLLAVPLLLVSLWRLPDDSLSTRAKWSLAFCVAIVALPLLQLVPLPPEIWTTLPNREVVRTTYDLVGREPPWMPISIAPRATWLSVISLVVPLAIFVGTIQLDYRRRRALSLVVLAAGVLSVFVGLTQVAQGPSSSLRFFEFSNPTETVGFFANRNHFAALLYCLILIAAAWATQTTHSIGSGSRRKKFETTAVLALICSFVVLVTLVAAQMMARSRAGLGLSIVALLGALALAFADRRSGSAATLARLLVGATAVAVVFAFQFALYRVMERFAVDPLQDARIAFARTTFAAAKSFMPFGSGMGTFVPVYELFEKPQDVLANTYANRAHNDLLELWLEAGLPGLLLMGIFAVWYVASLLRSWRRSPPGLNEFDQTLARAGTLVVGLLIAHSLVDYPLRTGAMMAILAFACALLIEPPPAGERERPKQRVTEQRHGWDPTPHRPSMPGAPSWWEKPMTEQAPPPPEAGERWGEDIEWPEEWRHPSGRPRRPDRENS